jgi:hypothetical protein
MTNDRQVYLIWTCIIPYKNIRSKPNIRNYVLCVSSIIHKNKETPSLYITHNRSQLYAALSCNPSNIECLTRVVPFTVYLLFKPIGGRMTKEGIRSDFDCWALLLCTCTLTDNASTHVQSYNNREWITGLWTHWPNDWQSCCRAESWDLILLSCYGKPSAFHEIRRFLCAAEIIWYC